MEVAPDTRGEEEEVVGEMKDMFMVRVGVGKGEGGEGGGGSEDGRFVVSLNFFFFSGYEILHNSSQFLRALCSDSTLKHFLFVRRAGF